MTPGKIAYILLKSGVSVQEIGELTFPQIRLFVKYYFEERGEWLQIVNSFLGGEGTKSKGASQLARETPGATVEVVESDNPFPDGMVVEVDD